MTGRLNYFLMIYIKQIFSSKHEIYVILIISYRIRNAYYILGLFLIYRADNDFNFTYIITLRLYNPELLL